MWEMEKAEGFLTEEERAQVRVLFEGIFPAAPEAGVPGAARAGAERFLSLLLGRSAQTFRDIPAWRTLYRTGLAALEAWVQRNEGCALIDLDAERVQTLLGQLSEAALDDIDPAVDQAELFQAIRRHAIQGCFADPRWGGNDGQIMWKWFGYLQDSEDLDADTIRAQPAAGTE